MRNGSILLLIALTGCHRDRSAARICFDHPEECCDVRPDVAQCQEGGRDDSAGVGDSAGDGSCEGAASETCGNCGIHTRACLEGSWGPWSACVSEGVCKPGDTRMNAVGCELPQETRAEQCSETCAWTPSACTLQSGWRRMAPAPSSFPSARTMFGSVWTGRHFVVYGGSDPAGKYLNDLAAYDAATDTWLPVASPPPGMPTDGAPGVWAGTKAFFWGGNIEPSAAGALYDPATNTWETLPVSPLAARCGHAMLWIPVTGEVVVFGGGTGGTGFVDAATYIPATKSWLKLPDAPVNSGVFWFSGPFYARWRGADAIFAGEAISKPFYHVLNPSTRAWTLKELPDLPPEYLKDTRLVLSSGEFSYNLVSKTSRAQYREAGGWLVGAGWLTGGERYPTFWSSADSVRLVGLGFHGRPCQRWLATLEGRMGCTRSNQPTARSHIGSGDLDGQSSDRLWRSRSRGRRHLRSQAVTPPRAGLL